MSDHEKSLNVVSDTRELRDSAVTSRDPYIVVALEALLHTAVSMPARNGPQAVVAHLLDALQQLLPGAAVGAHVVDPYEPDPIVEMRLPEGVGEQERDPTRLFPNLDHEETVSLDGLDGSTLHAASAGQPLNSPFERLVITQGARVLAAGLRASFELAAGAPPSRDVGRLRAQLIQAEKLASLGQIVAGVVHELANPLTSIVAYADYLAKKSRAQAGNIEDVERLVRIGEAAERILKFSRDIVAYARPADEAPGPVSLHEIIDQAAVFCEHEFAKNEVELYRSYAESVSAVLGRAGPLTQVFVNLFTNAAHAMSDHGGRLTVTTTPLAEGNEVEVQIIDTGIGIEQAALSHIFEPFFTTKEKSHGTGLGLSIVYDILRSHSGSVAVASTPGEGTKFTLTLPAYMPQSSRRTRDR